jgi:hypothetical protein
MNGIANRRVKFPRQKGEACEAVERAILVLSDDLRSNSIGEVGPAGSVGEDVEAERGAPGVPALHQGGQGESSVHRILGAANLAAELQAELANDPAHALLVSSAGFRAGQGAPGIQAGV